MAERDFEILQRAREFFETHVAPYAQDIDLSSDALGKALARMGDAELMALRRPSRYGGPEIAESSFRQFQEMSARYSGSLSFLMTQHQSAVSMLARCENERLKAELLPLMGDGRFLSGIGFSQLRRKGPPIMNAEEAEGGYLLNGKVPWITGWSFYDAFLIGAALPEGKSVYGFVPFYRPGSKWQANPAEVSFSEPMRLAAMESAQTVSADIRGYLLPAEHVVFVKPSEWAHRNDMINIVLQGHFALGCAAAGIDVLWAAYEAKQIEVIKGTAEKLEADLERCRAAATAIPPGFDSETTSEKLEIRAWAIELAARCAHAAVVASSGAANSLQHPAQRIYREALVYSVSAQTVDIMEATLGRLATSSVPLESRARI